MFPISKTRFQTTMFPMYFFCFQYIFDVSNVRFLFPISFWCFQCTFFVSNRFQCFQSTMFPIDVSNLHITFVKIIRGGDDTLNSISEHFREIIGWSLDNHPAVWNFIKKLRNTLAHYIPLKNSFLNRSERKMKNYFFETFFPK